MQRPRVWPVFIAFLVASAGMFVASVVAMLVWFGPQKVRGADGDLGLPGLIVTVLAAETALLLCVLLFTRPMTVERLRLGPSRARPLTLAAVTIGTLTVGQVLDSLTVLLGFYDTGVLAQLRQIFAGARGTPLFLSLLVVGVLAGSAEELFFRGFAQARLVQRWGRRAGVIVASVLFGLLHMDPVHSVLAFGLGLWLGHVTERAGSIRPAMLAHIVNNLAATALAAARITSADVMANVVAGTLSLTVFVLCVRHVVQALPLPTTVEPAPA